MNPISQVAINELREDASRTSSDLASSSEHPRAPAALSEGELVERAALEVAREWSGTLATS